MGEIDEGVIGLVFGVWCLGVGYFVPIVETMSYVEPIEPIKPIELIKHLQPINQSTNQPTPNSHHLLLRRVKPWFLFFFWFDSKIVTDGNAYSPCVVNPTSYNALIVLIINK